ncbi:MAG TPA: S8 family serine peptidase [bacterium]|jgi:hypothetical protein
MVKGKAMLVVKTDTSFAALSSLCSKYAATVEGQLPTLRMYLLAFPESLAVVPLCADFETNSNTLHCCPDIIFHPQTADSCWSLQWSFKNTGQGGGTIGADMMIEEAHAICRGSRSTRLAILDTGVPTYDSVLTHPDLADSTRIILDTLGYPSYGNPPFPERAFDDVRGHGTHVAGIALAEENSYGVVGVCPACTGLIVKMVYQNDPDAWTMAVCITHADVSRHAQILNISYSVPVHDNPALDVAIDAAGQHGALLAFACGNELGGTDCDYPANLADDAGRSYVLAIAGTNPNDERLEGESCTHTGCFHSRAGHSVTVAAPGGGLGDCSNDACMDIVSDRAPHAEDSCRWMCTEYPAELVQYMEGTSMSSPAVAGIAGLLKSYDSTLSASQIRSILEQSADDILQPGPDTVSGYGRVNAFKALLRAPGVKTLATNLTIRPHIYDPHSPNYAGSGDSPYYIEGGLIVPAGKTLTLQPGVRLTFGPGATLEVLGTLVVNGTASDSVRLEPSGTGTWGPINVHGYQSSLMMSYGVVRGGGIFVYKPTPGCVVNNSHLYDCGVGLDISSANMLVDSNLIEACTNYGIRGATSQGTITHNTIRNCGRGGVFWVGDDPNTGEAALFDHNTIVSNGTGTSPIAGCYFNTTTARLTCNRIALNLPYQIKCENAANIVLNQYGQASAGNYVGAGQSALWCGSCGFTCICEDPPAGFAPLVYLSTSYPLLNSGFNTFHFDVNGTYMYDVSQRCRIVKQHNVKENYFEPDNSAPSSTNKHFCPTTGFVGQPSASGTTCGTLIITEKDPAFAAYSDAAASELNSSYSTASEGYRAMLDQYPDDEAALWAARGALRTGLHTVPSGTVLFDSLYTLWADTTRPMAVRYAGRREAVWALIAAQNYVAATTELQTILAEPAGEDSLWAAVASDIVSLLSTGGPQVQSTPASAHRRLSDFYDRLNHRMGRPSDQEVLDSQPVVQSEKLCKAYPNPFNNTVNIQFELTADAAVRLDVFNLLGQKVATLVNQPMKAGSHTYSWSGESASSGVYFYRFQAGTHVETQKLMLLK